MEYVGIVVGIVLFLLGVKMMATGGTSSKVDPSDSNAMYQQPFDHRLDYKKREPEDMMYSYGKMLSVIGFVVVLTMILLLTGIF